MAFSSFDQLAISALVEARRRELALTRAAVVHGAGYRNTAKGIRRLDKLLDGDLESTKFLMAGLHVALELPSEAIAEAVERTQAQLDERERHALAQAEAEWRANFRPHVCILTERTVPQPIFIAAFCKTDQLLQVELDGVGRLEAVRLNALAAVQARIAAVNGTFPGFGRPTGFVLNCSPDFAVRFDLAGNPKELLASAYRRGRAVLFLEGGRTIPEGFYHSHGSATARDRGSSL